MYMRRDFLGLIAVVAAFVIGGTILMQSKILPEERAQDFRTLENISLQSQIQVIQEPTASDNTYIYAINEVARESWEIAKQDARVQAIIDGSKGKALTIAAVQPSAFVSPDGKVTHSGLGQVYVTANWQAVDGKQYASAKSFSSLNGKQGQSRQQIWDMTVDLDKDKVISIQSEQERVMTETLRTNVVYGGMNMYMPDVAVAKAGSSVRWVNESNIQHNVVGTYKTEAGEEKIDSGFFKANVDWKHTFSEKGTFDYYCTIHSEDGMKGRLVIS